MVTDAPNIPEPPFWGVRVKHYDVREVFPYINETALFKNQWQLKTASQADYVRLVEEKFRPIKGKLEEEVAGSGLFEPKVVYGYFPCQSDGNDVVVYEPEDQDLKHRGHRGTQGELLRFTFPRQREGRRLCISDFFASKASGKMDVIGFSLVTIGARASVETQKLFEGGEYTKYLYLHGLSVETAEALAELHHKKMREELGISGRGCGGDSRFVSSEVSGIEVFVWVSGVPESGGPDEVVCAAEAGGECGSATDVGIFAGAGAVDVGAGGASSGGEVFCGEGRRDSPAEMRRSCAVRTPCEVYRRSGLKGVLRLRKIVLRAIMLRSG